MSKPDYTFLIDQQANDPVTARFPRTMKEAFGPYESGGMRDDDLFCDSWECGVIIFVVRK